MDPEIRFCVCGDREDYHSTPHADGTRPCAVPHYLVPCPCKDFKEAVPSHRLYGNESVELIAASTLRDCVRNLRRSSQAYTDQALFADDDAQRESLEACAEALWAAAESVLDRAKKLEGE